MSNPVNSLLRLRRLLWSCVALAALSACGGADDNAGLLPEPAPADVSVTVSKVGSGMVTSTPEGISCGSNCDGEFSAGKEVILQAKPQTGYKFVGWSGSGVDCDSDASCTVMADANRSVTATFTKTVTEPVEQSLNVTVAGSGRVTSNAGGIDCTSDCSATFTQGASVILTATANTGQVFKGWSGSGISCAGTGPCTVQMSAARSVTATFAAAAVAKYVLHVDLSGSGSVVLSPSSVTCSAACDNSFDAGTVVTLAASPKAGYAFTSWGGVCSGSGTCTVTMSVARTVSALFTAVPTPALNIAVTGSGTVTSSPAGINCGTTCSATFAQGASVTLTAAPAAGYTFTGWANGCTGTGTCAVTMSASKSISATFTRITRTLAVTKQGSGTVTSSPAGISCGATCSASFNDGSTVALTAAPSAGYTFTGWSGGCTGTGTCSVTLSAAASVTATFTATPYALAVTKSGSGTVTSAPAGISCGSTCSASFNAGTTVVLTAAPAAGYTFSGWSGACSGSSTCSVAVSAASTATATFALAPVEIPVNGAPNVIYTDALSGPTKGGENNLGGYLSIFGKNFGSASALGSTTKVYIGATEVANYRYLGSAKVATKLGLQQLTVQVGALAGATAGAALPVKVVVNGVSSNVDNTFTPTNGKVLFVSLSGSDSTAVAGDIAKPYRYLQNNSATSGAYYAMGAGDHVVIRGGNWTDTLGVDGTWMRASLKTSARNGTASAWIHITAYPGPINGNAIEDVHYSTPAGKSGGIAGAWEAISGTSGEYWSISNLRMDVNAAAAADAAPFNLQYGGGHWRIVNNEMGPWPVAGVSAARAAGVTGRGDDVKVLGNHIHDIAGTSALENHGIYLDGGTSNWEIAHNWIHDITGGSLIQLNDANGLAGSFTKPHGGTWMGFTGMEVHNNWLENAAKYGLNISDVGSVGNSVVEYRGWNNVIIGTKLPPIRMNSSAKTMDVTFAYNTLHNAMVSNSGSGNGYFRNEGKGTGAIRIYDNLLSFGASTVTGTNWFYDYSGTSTGWTFKSNLYWDAGRGGATVPSSDTAKVVGDPKFVNAAAGDLSLQSGSPAVDKGLQALPFSVLSDLTGMLLRLGSTNVPDIGAFELAQ